MNDVYKECFVKLVIIRFFFELNGYLYIGYVKVIVVNFGFVRYYGGYIYLCMDDINFESEEEEYFILIEEIVCWFGFELYKIIYLSDYFDILYVFVEKLIE